MSKSTSIIVFVIAAILFALVVAFTYQEVDFQSITNQFSVYSITNLLALGLLFHLSFGLIMWVGFWLHYKLKIHPIEILTLPLMMHLFLYLMPVKGGMLFQVFYSKHKYKLDLSKGFSLGMTVFFMSLILTVLFGIVLIYAIPIDSFELELSLWAMAIGFGGMLVTLNLLPSNRKFSLGFLNKLIDFLISVRIQLVEQFKNFKLSIGLLLTTAISVVAQAILFWQTALVLGIISEFLPVLLVVLILRILLLIRLLPGNLGIQEVVIGVTFAAAGFQMEDGLLIGIITRLISVFWTALIGLPALYSNLKYFDTSSLSSVISRVNKSNQ